MCFGLVESLSGVLARSEGEGRGWSPVLQEFAHGIEF